MKTFAEKNWGDFSKVTSFSTVAVSLGVKTHTFFHNIEENNTKNQFVRLNCFCRILAHYFQYVTFIKC